MTEREALKLVYENSTEHDWPEDIWNAIKEALAQPEQGPVAWSYWQSCLNDDGTQTAPWVHRLSKFKPNESIINKDVTPLYTTPPQRTWVGLTERERMMCRSYDIDEAILNTEAKLKEKNCDR